MSDARTAIAADWNRYRNHPFFDASRLQFGHFVFTPLAAAVFRLLRVEREAEDAVFRRWPGGYLYGAVFRRPAHL